MNFDKNLRYWKKSYFLHLDDDLSDNFHSEKKLHFFCENRMSPMGDYLRIDAYFTKHISGWGLS